MIKSTFFVAFYFLLQTAYADFLPQSFSSKFEQEYTSTLKGKLKKGFGSIEYKYPGHIRFETNTPSTVIFVSNGKKSWYYRAPFIDGEQGEVTETSAKEGSLTYTRFFDSLNSGLVSNQHYDVIKGKPLKLVFKNKISKEIGMVESHLFFKSQGSQKFEDIEAIELIFSDGKKSKLKFVELKINQFMGVDRFNFVVPTNTKIVN